MEERFVEEPADVVPELLVPDLEPAVVQVRVDELDVLPGTVEEDPRQREIGHAEQVLSPDTRRESFGAPPLAKRLRQSVRIRPGRNVECKQLELLDELSLAGFVECDVVVEILDLRARVVGELERKAAQTLDERLDVDRQELVGLDAAGPRPLSRDVLDLLGERELVVRERRAERCEAVVFRAGHRLSARLLPERKHRERERGVVTGSGPAEDAHLPQVEQDPEVESALVHVRADLRLVPCEVLVRARVEHEGVRDQVVRSEVRLPSGLSELLEVGAAGEPEHPLDDRAQDRLGQDLLVGTLPGDSEIAGEILCAAKLLEDRPVVVDRRLEPLQEIVANRARAGCYLVTHPFVLRHC